MTSKKRLLIGVAVACIAIAMGLSFTLAQPKNLNMITPASGEPGKGPSAVVVEAQKVSTEHLARSIQAVGTLISSESVVLSPEISGRVIDISFEEGADITAGTPMIKLDDSIYKAQLAEAEASLILSSANYERAKKLYAQQSGTGRARDESLAAMKRDQAGVDLAQAQLSKTIISAPFNGTAGLRQISIGDYVTPGQSLVNIESINPLKVDFKIPEIYLNVLKNGQAINVVLDAFPGRVFTGEVYAIDPRIDESGRVVVLRAKLPNEERLLRPGLFARVNLVVENRADAIIIPEQAIVPQGNNQFVYIVRDGKAVMTKVVTGQRRQGSVEITDGLGPNDIVVTAGQIKLRPNAPVRVLDDAGRAQ